MPQYRTGTVTISGGSAVVQGSGTAWQTAGVQAGHTFKKAGENAVYEIAAVPSETQLILTANYAGSGEAGVGYQILKDFTTYAELPEIWAGDKDWPYHLTVGLRKIDQYLGGALPLPNYNCERITLDDIATPEVTDILLLNRSGIFNVTISGESSHRPVRMSDLRLVAPGVAHGMTSVITTDVFGYFAPISSAIGGLDIYGLTDADQAGALRLTGIIGATNPTDTYTALHLRGGKKSGTGWTDLGAAETALILSNHEADILTILGSGASTFASTVTTTGLISSGTSYIGDTANANVTQGLTINQGANDDEILSLKSSDVAQPATSITEADTYGFLSKYSATAGGLHVTGLTDTDAAGALVLRGIIGAANPTDTNAAIIAAGGKYNATGTTWQALGDAETVFQLKNYTTDLITVLGDGKVGVRTSTPTVAQVEIYGATNTNTLLAVGPGSSVVGSEILRVHDLSGGAAGMSLFKVTQGNTVASPASTYFTVVYGNNIGIGTATFGTSAAKVLAIALGTAPTTSPADAAQVWVQDQASIAGKASLHMRNEAGNTGPVAFAMGIVTSHGATETATADTLYGNTHLVTGAYTVTLPAVSVGMKGRFLATTAATFSVDCNAADHFVLGGTALTAGNKVTSDGSAGAFFEWEVTAANTITITFSNVTFTDGGA